MFVIVALIVLILVVVDVAWYMKAGSGKKCGILRKAGCENAEPTVAVLRISETGDVQVDKRYE